MLIQMTLFRNGEPHAGQLGWGEGAGLLQSCHQSVVLRPGLLTSPGDYVRHTESQHNAFQVRQVPAQTLNVNKISR